MLCSSPGERIGFIQLQFLFIGKCIKLLQHVIATEVDLVNSIVGYRSFHHRQNIFFIVNKENMYFAASFKKGFK